MSGPYVFHQYPVCVSIQCVAAGQEYKKYKKSKGINQQTDGQVDIITPYFSLSRLLSTTELNILSFLPQITFLTDVSELYVSIHSRRSELPQRHKPKFGEH